MVRFRILGRVEVGAGGQVLDLGRRQRELLRVLLLRANETVTLDHLVEFCFSGRVPPSARRQVQNTAGRFRKAFAGIEQARMAALEDCPELELCLGHHRDLLAALSPDGPGQPYHLLDLDEKREKREIRQGPSTSQPR